MIAEQKKQQYSISQWHDTDKVLAQLDALVGQPMRPIRRDKMAEYLDYFTKRCVRSKEMTDKAKTLIQKLIFATAIVVLLVLVALGKREAFIVGTAVIITLAITLFASWAWGFTLNRVSLFALIFSIGILVDDSIVVIENIERHREMGKTPLQAALHGRREIGLAAVTITLVDVVVYLPVAFMSGIVGQFFFSYGVTIAVAALSSLFVAFTLTPMLAGYWLEDKSRPKPNPT